MTQDEQRLWLLEAMLTERSRYQGVEVPEDAEQQWLLLRALMNVRPPWPVSSEFLVVQDAYLQELIADKGVTDYRALEPVEPGIYLWRGDITTLAVDAIVNAANSRMLGCFVPNHRCIDNAIHTFAGVQLRLACAELMEAQGHPEPTGKAKITPAFNLPSRYVIHTVGPVVQGPLTDCDRGLLASCYESCLEAAATRGLSSIAFCCISTGEFGFPKDEAARIAVTTVRDWRGAHSSAIDVVFDVFKEVDYGLYQRLL